MVGGGNQLNQGQTEEIRKYLSLEVVTLEQVLHDSIPNNVKENIAERLGVSPDGGQGREHEEMWGVDDYTKLKQELTKYVNGLLTECKDVVYQRICVDISYCDRRKKGRLEQTDVAIAVADALITASTGLPFPVTLVSAYLIKSRLLDQWCNCPNNG